MKALVPVLSSLDIHHAISLDDDYSMASKMERPELISIEDFFHACDEEFTEAERNSIEDAGVSTIEDILQSDFLPQGLKDKVAQVLSSKVKPVAALSFLENGFKDSDISYETLDDVCRLENAPNIGTIWFLDREMGNRDILPEIVPKIFCEFLGKGTPCLIVLFTMEDRLVELNVSWDKRFSFLTKELRMSGKDAEILSYSFFVISKKTVSEKLENSKQTAIEFVEDILINSLTGYCSFNIVAKMRQYSENAYDNLLNIAKNAQKSTIDTIRYNMVKEGEPNIYHSFKTIHDLMQEEQYTIKFHDIEKYILAIKRATQISNLRSKEIVKQSLEDIILHHNWAQHQFIHKDTNISFQDVSYGDIFRLRYEGLSCIGVLITQPCDCVLRTGNDDKIVKRKAKHFTLLVYEELFCDKSSLSNRKLNDIHNNGIIYDYHITDDNWEISYIDATNSKSAFQVAPAILDLTSLNSEGKAVLLSKEEIRQCVDRKKTQNWEGYISELQQDISTIQGTIQFLSEKISVEADKLDQVLLSIYNVPFSLEDRKFLIQRIGHLDTNLVEFASYQYTSRTYRTGKNSLIALHNPYEQGEE